MKKPWAGKRAFCLVLGVAVFPLITSAVPAAADGADWTQMPRFYVAFSGGAVYPGKTVDKVGAPVSGNIEVEGNTGSRFGGAIGYMLKPSLAIEGEIATISANPKSASLVSGPAAPLGPFPASGTVTVNTVMANLIVGAPMGMVRPYVGGGVGLAYFNATNVMAGPLGPLAGNDTGLGLQAIAGIDLALNSALSLGARYRYLHVSGITLKDPVGLTNDITTQFQSVEAVLTVHLGN